VSNGHLQITISTISNIHARASTTTSSNIQDLIGVIEICVLVLRYKQNLRLSCRQFSTVNRIVDNSCALQLLFCSSMLKSIVFSTICSNISS